MASMKLNSSNTIKIEKFSDTGRGGSGSGNDIEISRISEIRLAGLNESQDSEDILKDDDLSSNHLDYEHSLLRRKFSLERFKKIVQQVVREVKSQNKLNKFEDKKTVKQSKLDKRHSFMIEQVAYCLGLNKSEVENDLLDGRQLELIDNFLSANRNRLLIFQYIEQLPTTTASSAQLARVNTQKSLKARVRLVKGSDLKANGVVVYFTRITNRDKILFDKIHKEVCFGFFDFRNSDLLTVLKRHFTSIYLPVLSNLDKASWSQKADNCGLLIKNDYLAKIAMYVQTLEETQASLNERVILKQCEELDLPSLIQSQCDYATIATNTDALFHIEECVKGWMKQIVSVLAECEQIRREAENIGPRAELEYWKKRTSKFNNLLEQLKSKEVKTALGILLAAKSRTILAKWRELDGKITDYSNEARDNVKYLYTLERFCDPLYNSDPVSMISDLPGFMNAIRMIHSISRYYNTSERMTSLFLKITNQMITACKSYVSDNETQTIWSQPQVQLIKKLNDCIHLNKEYQACFHRVKERLEKTPEQPQFDFSSIYAFGKIEAFSRRCQKIIELFATIAMYSRLQESKIEGLEILAARFNLLVNLLKRKNYDILDQRKSDFDTDYKDFQAQVQELHESIVSFIDDQFETITSTDRALHLIRRFEKLKLPNLGLDDKYVYVLRQYAKDLELVSQIYQKMCKNPPLIRNMPPISGKILWSRQLYKRIEQPMSVFQVNGFILKIPEAKQIIKNFNKLSAVLIKYEILHHMAWLKQINLVLSSVHSSIIVRDTETNEYLVNFDLEIFVLIREIECMKRLNLSVPEDVDNLILRQKTLISNYNRLKFILAENKRVRSQVPSIFENLIQNKYQQLDQFIAAGLSLTWLSLNVDDFCNQVLIEIEKFDIMLKKAIDLRQYRIEAVFDDMAKTNLLYLNENEPMSIEDFVNKTKELCDNAAIDLKIKSQNVEEATEELIELFLPEYKTIVQDIEEDFKIECKLLRESQTITSGRSQTSPIIMRKYETEHLNAINTRLAVKKRYEKRLALLEISNEIFNHFNHKNLDVIIKLIKNTLEKLRKRISAAKLSTSYSNHSDTLARNSEAKNLAIFKCFGILAIPTVTMQPSLDDVQQSLNKVVQTIITVSSSVKKWNRAKKVVKRSQFSVKTLKNNEEGIEIERTATPFEHHQNYLKPVSQNKDIIKLIALLSTSITLTKNEVQTVIDHFKSYQFIWLQDRDEQIKEFLNRSPTSDEYEERIKYFEKIIEEIKSYDVYIKVGAIAFFTENLKLGLINELVNWKSCYGFSCNQKYKKEINDVFIFIDEIYKRLNRDIFDLEDIKLAMSALKELRENEIRIDMCIQPIEEIYNMLQRHEILVPRDDIEKCDTLRYSYNKLIQLAGQRSSYLLDIQPNFKNELMTNLDSFNIQCEMFYSDYKKKGPMITGIPPREASDRLYIFQKNFDVLYRKYQTYTNGQELFGLPVSTYPELMKIRKELGLLQKLYSLYNTVIQTVNSYYDIAWSEISIEKINNELAEFQNKCRRLPKGLKDWMAFEDLKKTVDDFSECCPLLELMTNKAMKVRHWERICDLTKQFINIEDEDLKLRDIMCMPLLKYKEEIEDICVAAVKEKEIEAKLKQITNDWIDQEFSFASFKNRGELLLKGDRVTEVLALLEESIIILNSLMSNRYNTPFKKTIQQWVKNLSETNEILENLMQVQNLWIYLEAVFIGGDIAKQLPAEAKRFMSIDKSWNRIMQRAHDNTNIILCCTIDETLVHLLPHLLEELELCQKSLTGYLEKKRLIFPRFFFVSDPALLEILGQASDCHTIQAHLLSIFDNTKSLTFHEKDYNRILAIHSNEGETIELEKPIRAEGNVEQWLMLLLNAAQKSLHVVIRTAFLAISDCNTFNILDFFSTFPTQVALLGLQMIWTRDATYALKTARQDKRVMQQMNGEFLDLLNMLIQETTKELNKVERTKFETLITIQVHQRDIFDDMCKMHIKSVSDFEWLKQTRFYFVEDKDQMIVSITDVDFIYQNEFLGCTERLVITPLTDRCYITLAQAIHMSMGGAPAGPAGTGKTETIKDMGRSLGKYVVLFNCSDQIDFRGLGRIFKGLAQSGTWGCFDEFNRIALPVLSVAAQQIAIVLSCKKEKRKSFTFTDGDNIDMSSEFGIFLTMNPRYAGRQELPENLKINFRTVAMMVPDRLPIIRVKMASVGFLDNFILSRKFYTLYKLCEEQLSQQIHYDFGLRNILSVLRTLGTVKRANSFDSEQTIVMRVLRDMNLSKLIDEDEPLFKSLINDLFPSIALENSGYPELEAAIDVQVKSHGLINHPPWTLKLIQLYETQLVRHGMMTIGPTGVGKTCCIQFLMKALTEIGETHREMRMNPKAITAPQMFGKLDVATNDWTDGIFSTLWRRTLKNKKNEHVWIVLDGPVDTIWIENLNSVLDDNKTLTLANGDRIPMSPTCKIIFEPHNIDNASPATVSRNGMVYMSSSGLDYCPLVKGWLCRERPQAEYDIFISLYQSSFPHIYRYFETALETKMSVLECIIVSQSCNLLAGLLPPKENKEFPSRQHLERLYAFSIMWSFGAFLELDDRRKLQIMLMNNDDFKLDLPVLDRRDDEETIYDYFVTEDTGEWRHWHTKIDEYIYPTDHTPEYDTILVPNVDNVRAEFLINTLAKQGKAVLLIGESGTAKTSIVKTFLNKYNPDEHLQKCLNFSSATTPNMFQRSMESYLEKRVGATFGPPAGKKMTIFIDDISMPVVNEWGDQITNELVRQAMEQGGFYNLDKPGDFTHIIDIHFMAAMIHPGGGRNDIPQRLKRQFSIFNCTLPSNQSMDKIFSLIGLGHYCNERQFGERARELVRKLVPATRKLWQLTKLKMLPTPAKFHYIFNLRDLSRIWQGMINIQASVANNEQVMTWLWVHECTRVIADRFLSEDDVIWFEDTLKKVADEELGERFLEYITPNIMFTDFMRDISKKKKKKDVVEEIETEVDESDFEIPKIYEPVESFKKIEDRLKHFLAQYNESIRGAGMDLVFFHDAVLHLVRISRIIRMPRGNALLVGVGGSGKQSLTKLASFIANYKLFQISTHSQTNKSYNSQNLMEDLKMLYRIAGQQGKGVTFIFTDQDIKEETFLEYINNFLSSGVVAGLFARDEIDEICNDLVNTMRKEFPKRALTSKNLYEYFLSRTRQNLHLVLCFSPIGERFRNRAFKFPGLISGCTIDWFQRWPREALISVADHFLTSYEISCEHEVKKQLVECMGIIHDNVAETCHNYFIKYRRSTHVTPKSYLSFINGYKKIYKQKLNEINYLASRMNIGLDKLVEAGHSVAELKKELDVKETELAIANKKADDVLNEVSKNKEAAECIKLQVQKVKDKAQVIVNEIETDKAKAEEKLEAAKPALLAAEEALKTIKPADIATVRKLSKPPHLIQRIMDCVLLFNKAKMDLISPDLEKSCPKPSWNESLRLMAGTNFLNSLLEFKKDIINEETIEFVEPYIRMDDYDLETAKRVCGNVAGLLSWTVAMTKFYEVNKEVLPLKDNLVIQEVRLKLAMNDLQIAQKQLEEKEKELKAAMDEYNAAMMEKQKLMKDAERCRRRMHAASALIDGLADEKERWTEQSSEFREKIGRLVGDVLICTGFISYEGPFNQDYRNLLEREWQKLLSSYNIPYSTSINVVDFLTNSTNISHWVSQGLPNDELSIQNAIIVTQSARYPLLIDPQGQGVSWIKKLESFNELQTTSLNHKYFRQHVEEALTLGRPLLIEDVGEELDPILDNVLDKNFIRTGSSYKVKVGDKEVDVVVNKFRLFITTKLANPIYSPEISAKTSVVDFTVTIKGLEDQLLSRVINMEKRELELERLKLLEDVQRNKIKMKELEDNLLYRLTSVEGSLVDDEDLINVLQVTKITSIDVRQKLKIAGETSEKINLAREEYRPVATRGSIIYFLIVEMSMVNFMYQTSLKQFLKMFHFSLERSPKSQVTSKRIFNIIEFMTYEIHRYTVRGYYENHKFMFTLLLTLKIDIQSGRIHHEEFHTLVKGGSSLDLNTLANVKTCKWISDSIWLNLVELSKLPQFENILEQINRNEKAWHQWFDKDSPEDDIIPDGYQTSLDAFRKLLLIRSWCPDRTLSQAKKYISDSIGERFIEPSLLDLEKMFDESDPKTPLICFLSIGSDPTSQIEHLGKQKGASLKVDVRAISMGQGQEIHARRLVSLAIEKGGWVLLQNCHLSIEFCEEILETITTACNINENFRLWITTEPHAKFPIGLLQISLKYTAEPPQGIKAGLRRTFQNLSNDYLDITSSIQWKPLLYAVAFLHTIVQERRKYGPLGWNIPYEFNMSDFNATTQFIQNYLDDVDLKKGISWTTVRYMIGECQYGGRVTDNFDKFLLNSYVTKWFGDILFAPGFYFSEKAYSLPKFSKIEDLLLFINNLPTTDRPEAFGMHSNASITYQTNAAKAVLDTILSIQPKESSSELGETRESFVYKTAQDLLEKLPSDYIIHEVKASLALKDPFAPLNIFLKQEIDRMQKVIGLVRSTLLDLKLAIDGTIIMNETLRNALDYIYDAKIPELWQKISWESSTLGFWFSELIERDNQFRKWCFEEKPFCFWISGFFNAQGFLTAMRQEVTRANKDKGWALDTVILTNDVTCRMKDEINAYPLHGIYVYGLFLEGASWSKQHSRLVESKPKVLFEPMPVMHISAIVNSTEGCQLKQNLNYVCPIYKKPKRTDEYFIATANLRTNIHPDVWVLRGTCLLCDIK